MSKLWYVGNGTGVYKPSTKTTEAKLVTKTMTKVRQYFIDRGIPYFMYKVHGGRYQRSGLPDIYMQFKRPGSRDCYVLWVEMKLPGGDTTKLQRATLKELQESGTYVAACESVDDVLDCVREILEQDF